MKTKKLTLVLFIAIIGMLMYSCSFFQGTGSATSMTSLCLDYRNSDVPDLEVALIHKMTELYQNSVGFNGPHPTNEPIAVSFDFEALKNFVYHIEMEAKNNNRSSQGLGVRIYYARYPNRATWNNSGYKDLSDFPNNPITNQYEMLHTVVMVPTIKVGNKHFDFNPLDYTTYHNGLTESYNPSSSKYNGSRSVPALTGEEDSNAKNHGALYPPNPEDRTDGVFFNSNN